MIDVHRLWPGFTDMVYSNPGLTLVQLGYLRSFYKRVLEKKGKHY